jgi:dolichol kinase
MGALGMKETEQEEEGTYEHGLEDEQNDEHVVASYWQRMLPNLLPSLSILQPPVSVAVFLLLLLAFPWIRFSLWDLLLLLLLLLSLSLSLSLSAKINLEEKERKKSVSQHTSKLWLQ